MEIIPVFDQPHLFKCARNNWLDKDFEFECDDRDKASKKNAAKRKIGLWKHIIDVDEIDVYGQQNRRFLKKLTERHVYPKKIKKMRLKNAMQIFSNSMASRLDALFEAPG